MPRRRIALRSPKMAAAAKPRCNSESDGMELLEDGLGDRGFFLQYFESRNVGVPFDQRRLCTELFDGRAIQRPDRWRDACAVGVDEAGARVLESSEMNLGDGVGGNSGHIIERIEPVIHGVDVDVVHVEEKLAASAAHD